MIFLGAHKRQVTLLPHFDVIFFGFQSRNHDWRIHRDPVWEEQFADRAPEGNIGNSSDEGEHKEHIEEERRVSMEEAVQRACSRVGEVYNPFDVNTNVSYFFYYKLVFTQMCA